MHWLIEQGSEKTHDNVISLSLNNTRKIDASQSLPDSPKPIRQLIGSDNTKWPESAKAGMAHYIKEIDEQYSKKAFTF